MFNKMFDAEITKDMIPIADDFPSREEMIKKAKSVRQKQLNQRINKEFQAISKAINEAAENGETKAIVSVHGSVGTLFVEPLKEAGYEVFVLEKYTECAVLYTIEWIYDKRVGDN